MTLWQVFHSKVGVRPCYMCGGIFPYSPSVGLITPALDNSGQFVITGTYYIDPKISLDSGVSWSTVSPWPGYAGFESVDCSLDGKHLIVCENPGRLQVSWDYGVTWPYGIQGANHVWGDVRVSADGQVCLAYDQFNNYYNSGRLYLSTDKGVTWIVPNIGTVYPNAYDPYIHSYYGMACNAVGSKIATIRDAPDFTVDLWITNNFGVDYSWVKAAPSGSFNVAWSDVDMDSDGSVIIVCKGTSFYVYSDTGSIWISKDGGSTWAQSFPLGDGLGHSWNNVCCSEDGSVMLARKRNSQYYDSIWYSWDTGATWREVLPAGAINKSWGKPKVSGGGTVMGVVTTNSPWDAYVCQLAQL